MNFPAFGVEEWLNSHEKKAKLDIAQSTVSALSIEEFITIDGKTQVSDFFLSLAQLQIDYGWIEGSYKFKTLVSNLYKNITPENILQTNGGTGANLLALLGILKEGDHVISIYPSYQQLYDTPSVLGADVSLLHLREERNWKVDVDELLSLIKPNTRLISLNNANNPTGMIIEENELREIVNASRKIGAYILCDEVFQSFDPNVTMTPIADIYERGISTNSLSKTYSLPGLRVGWTACGEEITETFRHLRDYTMISCGVLNNLLAEHALSNSDLILERNRRIVLQNFEIFSLWLKEEKRVSCVLPKATPTSFVKFDIKQNIETFCENLLEETGILLVPGNRFGFEGYARLGYCVNTEILKKGLSGLSEYLKKV